MEIKESGPLKDVTGMYSDDAAARSSHLNRFKKSENPDQMANWQEINHFDVGPKTAAIIFFAILILRIILHVVLYRRGFESLTADEWGRVFNAGSWAERPYLRWSGAWLPFHVYLLGIALKIYHNLVWVPRVFTIIFGLISLTAVYSITYLLSRNRIAGLVSMLLLCFNPVNLWLSATPLTEMPSSAMILVAIAGALLYLREGKAWPLRVSALALFLANGLRYESWIYSGLFSLLVVVVEAQKIIKHQKSIREAAPFILTALIPWIVPVVWLVGNYVQKQDALYFVKDIRNYKATYYGAAKSFLPYLKVLVSLDVVVLILGVLAFGYTLSRRPTKLEVYHLIFTLIPLLLYILLSGGQTEPRPNYIRYLGPFTFLFYPLISAMVLKLLSSFSKHWKPTAAALLVLLCVYCGYLLRTSLHFTNDPSSKGLRVGLLLDQLRDSNQEFAPGMAIVERKYWAFTSVQIGVKDYRTVLFDSLVDRVTRKSVSYVESDWPLFEQCIKEHKVTYLVFASENLRKIIEKNIGIAPVADVNGYYFYQVPAEYRENISIESSQPNCPLTSY